jgi:ABC-type transport system substrate-binding protein
MIRLRNTAAATTSVLLARLLLACLLLACALPCRLAVAARQGQGPAQMKTLHMFLTGSETGLDPAVASDINSLSILENVFDPLLRYDYLARPLKLQGNTASAMPRVEDRGATYVFQIRPGIFFTPDPAFKGQRREVTAADYVYSLKRLYDPALKSPWLFLFENKILGDASLKPASGAFSYDTALAGLQALDRYTLRIRLTAPDPNFLFYMAMPATGAMAREVVDAYPGQVGNHPVGSGPFMVDQWKRSDKIVLQANPGSTAVFHGTPGPDGPGRALFAALDGKRLPRVDRVEIKVVEEYQARMLGFLKGEFDYLEQVPESMTGMVLAPGGVLKPELAQRGIALSKFPVLQTYYMWMNMDDPVVGGYTRDKLALRRAIALSYDSQHDIALLKKGLAIPAQSPLPPNVLGYDPSYRSPVAYDPALARALLERFGYRQRGQDGFRSMPDGKPLTLVMHTEPNPAGRLRDELWRKSLSAIGIRVVFKNDKKTEIIKASRLGKVQMFETNWIADFPDGDNFFQLLYGPNRGRVNYARFNLPAYNTLYERARRLPDSPERRGLYRDLSQLIHAYTPWVLLTHPISADLRQPWLENYQRHPVELTTWRYLDLDVGKQKGRAAD